LPGVWRGLAWVARVCVGVGGVGGGGGGGGGGGTRLKRNVSEWV